jgi:hypothetical protein
MALPIRHSNVATECFAIECFAAYTMQDIAMIRVTAIAVNCLYADLQETLLDCHSNSNAIWLFSHFIAPT